MIHITNTRIHLKIIPHLNEGNIKWQKCILVKVFLIYFINVGCIRWSNSTEDTSLSFTIDTKHIEFYSQFTGKDNKYLSLFSIFVSFEQKEIKRPLLPCDHGGDPVNPVLKKHFITTVEDSLFLAFDEWISICFLLQ